MKILFTGASSFTGYWFVRELAAAGHHVTATFRSGRDSYQGLRGQRARALESHCEAAYDCTFGSAEFFDVVAGSANWDLLCHHAADVENYKSADFDFAGALQRNTFEIGAVLNALTARGCHRVLLTGSIFEGGEGAGSHGLPAFSPYGLSKELTAHTFRYFCARAGVHLAKFVVPNPFGPLEEARFTAYLINTWSRGGVASVNTPDYVRDNIHVDLLARSYAEFAGRSPTNAVFDRLNPSGYVESQGRFAQRVADAMAPRLGLACRVELAQQVDFQEPMIRVNTDAICGSDYGWNAEAAWDAMAAYYAESLASNDMAARHG